MESKLPDKSQSISHNGDTLCHYCNGKTRIEDVQIEYDGKILTTCNRCKNGILKNLFTELNENQLQEFNNDDLKKILSYHKQIEGMWIKINKIIKEAR